MKKCILAITDGIGINESEYFNAFTQAKKPNYDRLNASASRAKLATSGLAVGLPDGQIGNSEVGHMCLGSGRVIFQSLVKIDQAIASGEFECKIQALNLNPDSRIHIFGLYSDGGVHSSYEHFNATLRALKKLKNPELLCAHAITDGRDVLPLAAREFIAKNPPACEFASIAGRFWAMDRDNNHDRTQSYINMLKTPLASAQSPKLILESAFNNNPKSDEFLEPTKLKDFALQAGDEAIIINFRADRARQLAAALKELGLKTICMCEYDAALDLEVIFPPEDVPNCLAQVLSEQGRTQLHTSETEKYAHVSFFFNGGIEEPFKGEERILVPSTGAANYADTPQMSAAAITDGVTNALERGVDFVVLNYANGDMVGHTGDFDAAVVAVQTVDEQLGRLMDAAKKHDYALIITSDHGNCEQMRDEKSGEKLTNHTLFDVNVWLYNHPGQLKDGSLANVAATILDIMNIPAPEQMQESLLV